MPTPSLTAIRQALLQQGFVSLGLATICDLDHYYFAHPRLLLLADVYEWGGEWRAHTARTTVPHLVGVLARIYQECPGQHDLDRLTRLALWELQQRGVAGAEDWEVHDPNATTARKAA